VLQGGWAHASLDEAQAFLRLGPHRAATSPGPLKPLRVRSEGGTRHRLRPVAPELCAALEWLHTLEASAFFLHVWGGAAARAEEEVAEGAALTAAAAALDAGGDEGATAGDAADTANAMGLRAAELQKLAAAATAAAGLADGEGADVASEAEAAAVATAEREEAVLLATLRGVRVAWVQAYQGLDSGGVLLCELEGWAPLLLDAVERHALVCTASGLQDETGGVSVAEESGWPVREEVPPAWATALGAQLVRFAHVVAVRRALPHLRRVLGLLEQWLALSARPKAERVRDAASRLAAVSEARWEEARLAGLSAFAADAEAIDPRLIVVDCELLLAVQAAAPLLDWLRGMPSDTDFTSAVEMALGRGEMECPDEMWNAAQRGVDEAKLSRLASTRAYLHAHIYRPETLYAQWGEVLEVWGGLDWSKAVAAADNVRKCAELHGPLTELLAGDADSGAPSRLAQLQGARAKAVWRCSAAPPPLSELAEDAQLAAAATGATAEGDAPSFGGGHVWLEYVVVRQKRELRQVQRLGELADFQSAVVLSRSGARAQQMQGSIDAFVEQFGLMRLLAAALWALHEAGHGAYAQYDVSFPLLMPPEAIHAAVLGARASLRWWEAVVSQLRREHYFLNFAPVKELQALPATLASKHGSAAAAEAAARAALGRLVASDATEEQLAAQVATLREVRARGTDWQPPPAVHEVACRGAAADAAEADESVTSSACASGALGATVTGVGAAALDEGAAVQLKQLGLALDAALESLVPRRRQLTAASGGAAEASSSLATAAGQPSEEAGGAPAGEELPPGLHVMCAEGGAGVVEVVVSAYVRRGVLPEREELFVCGREAELEEALNLVRRWRGAATHGRASRLYCLAGVDTLPFVSQHALVAAAQEAAHDLQRDAAAGLPPAPPLLLVCASADASHVLVHFGHRRRPAAALPRAQLRAATAGVGFCARSAAAGGGKTFAVRAAAVRDGRRYVHCPVHSAGHAALMATLTRGLAAAEEGREEGEEGTPLLLHLDLADVSAELDMHLLELLLLGSLRDPRDGGEALLLAPPRVRLALEPRSGRTRHQLRMAALLPPLEARPAAATFVAARPELEAALGRGEAAVRHAQLHYVCLALHVLREHGGAFPFAFAGRDGARPLTSDEAKAWAEAAGGGAAAEAGGTKAVGTAAAHLALCADPLITIPAEELGGHECFELLREAMEEPRGATPSLWCVWSFVAALHWQLRELHRQDSAIGASLLPDPGAYVEYDAALKAKMKGELLQFLLATAREFATRRSALVVRREARASGVGFGEVNYNNTIWFNGPWANEGYLNEGQPCFGKPKRGMYLYYRAAERRWVISDSIAPRGSVLSATRGARIDGPWTTYCTWEEEPLLSVTEVRHRDGFEGQAVCVAGCRSSWHTPRDSENGTYLLQPPYADVDGRAHYVMLGKRGDDGLPLRRHLFFNGEASRWQISPLCNDTEGALARSATAHLTGSWCRRDAPVDEKGTIEYTPVREEAAGDAAAADDEGAAGVAGADDDEEAEGDEGGVDAAQQQAQLELLPWGASDHACVLFSSSADRATFLSLDPQALEARIHPHLLAHLKSNGVRIGEGLEALNARHHEVLSALTGVHRTKEAAGKLMGGGYCLTGDAMLKMLAIFVRVTCGIPVVLMGECGCGKTYLIKYLCAWLGVPCVVLDVHGGTTQRDIEQALERAEAMLRDVDDDCAGAPAPPAAAAATGSSSSSSDGVVAAADGGARRGGRRVFVFFDELNTCSHVSLLVEAATQHSLHGRPLHKGVTILAAVNPYRVRPEAAAAEEAAGLVYNLQEAGAPADPMASLVYRVHDVPASLQHFVFDFGALSASEEAQYVKAMLRDKLLALRDAHFEITLPLDAQCALALVTTSQAFARAQESDASAVSLRDVRRVCLLLDFFTSHLVPRERAEKAKVTPLAAAMVLSLAFVYLYRIPSSAARGRYWEAMRGAIKHLRFGQDKKFDKCGFRAFVLEGSFQRVIAQVQRRFVQHVAVEEGVALNEALSENLFVSIVCILNKLPLFLVGKPGTSKTLTMQVAAACGVTNRHPALTPTLAMRR